ncbi:MAG TPA: DUF1579 domain-containing protein [Lysobacter sp.]
MGRKEFEASIASGGHHRLAQMIGEWEGTFRLWFQPDHLACESPQRGTIRAILDGRFLLHEYRTRFGDDPIEGVAIYGLHLDDNAYESAWVESFATGTSIMFSAGPATAASFDVLGSYGDGQGGPRWDWRTQIEQPDRDTLVITMTNISPQGESAKAVEVRYHRIQPGV